jgi:hypothetical protein
MSQRYAKLYAKAGENPDVGELLEDDPLAVALFFLAIARADVYGILPAEPRRFRAAVSPAALLQTATVAQSLHNLESRGLVRCYTAADGTELLHILHYSDYQDVRWANRIGPPEHELPPWWEPPEAFLAYLDVLDLDRVRGEDKRKRWVVLRDCYRSATVALRENNARQNTEHRTQNTVNDSNDLLSESADGALPNAAIVPPAVDTPTDGAADEPAVDAEPSSDPVAEPPTEPIPAPDPQPTTRKSALSRKARTDDQLAGDIAEAREAVPPGLLQTLDLWLDNIASHNATGVMRAGRVVSETNGFADLTNVHGLSEAAIRHGVTEALSRIDRTDGKPGIRSLSYVLEVARGFSAEPSRASPSQQPGAVDPSTLSYHDRTIWNLLHPEEAASVGNA